MIGFSCERVIRDVGFNVIFCTPLLINENNFTVKKLYIYNYIYSNGYQVAHEEISSGVRKKSQLCRIFYFNQVSMGMLIHYDKCTQKIIVIS